MFIEQRQVGQMAVFAYLVGDEESGEALVIDPAADTDGTHQGGGEKQGQDQVYRQHPRPCGSHRRQRGHEERRRAPPSSSTRTTPRCSSPPRRRCSGCSAARRRPPADRTVQDGDLIDRRQRHPPGHPHPRSFPGQHGPATGRLRLHRRHPLRGGGGQDRPARRLRRGDVRFHPEEDSAPFPTRRWSCRVTTTAACRPRRSVTKNSSTPSCANGRKETGHEQHRIYENGFSRNDACQHRERSAISTPSIPTC